MTELKKETFKLGCFARIHLHEENARFLLVGVGLLMYLTFGAFLFNHLERENELLEREQVSIQPPIKCIRAKTSVRYSNLEFMSQN